MGERLGIVGKDVLKPVPKLVGMRLAASALDRMPDDASFYDLLRDDPMVRNHVRFVVEAADARFDATYPGKSRKAVLVNEWRDAGFNKVVRFMESVGLKSF